MDAPTQHCSISSTVNTVDKNRLEILSCEGPPRGNVLWRIEWSRYRWRHIPPICL